MPLRRDRDWRSARPETAPRVPARARARWRVAAVRRPTTDAPESLAGVAGLQTPELRGLCEYFRRARTPLRAARDGCYKMKVHIVQLPFHQKKE